jgi:fructose-1,6-bisphosphatase II / sedoheptulose-1,7-bisphosphatase
MPGSIATMAMADGGTLLHAPDVYMQKIAIGPGYAKNVIELDAPPAENIRRLAKAKDVPASAILPIPENTGIDIYIGTRGAPEGVLAAAALRCIGGQMQCRLILDTDENRERARKMVLPICA